MSGKVAIHGLEMSVKAMLSPSKPCVSTDWPLKILCTSPAGMGSEDSERLKLPRLGGADVRKENGRTKLTGSTTPASSPHVQATMDGVHEPTTTSIILTIMH